MPKRRATLPLGIQCRLARLPEPNTEYRFAPPRRWRFDYAWCGPKVALEVQGGLFVAGRHSRGAALLKEHEKLNTAAIEGWRILFCTPKQVADGSALTLIEQAMKQP